MTERTQPDDAWVVEYVGLDLEAALALAQSQGRSTRVLHPGDAMTLDWRPDRVNLYLDDAGELAEVRAG